MTHQAIVIEADTIMSMGPAAPSEYYAVLDGVADGISGVQHKVPETLK